MLINISFYPDKKEVFNTEIFLTIFIFVEWNALLLRAIVMPVYGFPFLPGPGRRHDPVVAILQFPRITSGRCHHDHLQLTGDRHRAVFPFPEGAVRCPARNGGLHTPGGRRPRRQTALPIPGSRKGNRKEIM